MSEQQHPTNKVCTKCNKQCTKADFAKRQWKSEQPVCRSCTESDAVDAAKDVPKKTCSQCKKDCDKEQFPTKQWKKKEPLCRLCDELTKVSEETSRLCYHCKVVHPRDHFNFHQWGRGNEALCHKCREDYEKVMINSLGQHDSKNLPNGTTVCSSHSLECCEICMMDFRLPNMFALKRAALGRDLTQAEYDKISNDFMGDINRKVCIMDGQPVCPRTGRKMRCPCNEVTYCSKECQVYHHPIHKMTCKHYAEKQQAKKKAGKSRDKSSHLPPPKVAAAAAPAHGLTEEQLNSIRKEAFFAENNGAEHSIEECAWQLGEHPLVIGGGSIMYTRGGKEEFVKGDVAKIYREQCGAEWDGSPRFGLGPYVQQKPYFDWIAKAREGPSEFDKKLEGLMKELKHSGW